MGGTYAGDMRTSAVSRALIALVAATAVFSYAPSAQAHTELTGTQPADGAQVKKPPAQVTLTFAEPPLDTGLAVVAQGPDGRSDLPAEVKGNSVVAQWPPSAGGGQYRVSYRVVASDGHPITGQLAFTVLGSPEPSTSSTPTPATPSAAPSAAADASTPDSSQPGIPLWLWVLGAVLIVAVGYVVIARGRRPRDD